MESRQAATRRIRVGAAIITAKEDEAALLMALATKPSRSSGLPPGYIATVNLGMDRNRARYILRDKWCDKQIYDYGTSWWYGWLEVDIAEIELLDG